MRIFPTMPSSLGFEFMRRGQVDENQKTARVGIMPKANLRNA